MGIFETGAYDLGMSQKVTFGGYQTGGPNGKISHNTWLLAYL